MGAARRAVSGVAAGGGQTVGLAGVAGEPGGGGSGGDEGGGQGGTAAGRAD